MSNSPQKEGAGDGEVVQSPSDSTTGQQNHKQNPEEAKPEEKQTSQEAEDEMQGHPATQEQASLYETEVKEQDRWLPIANGWFRFIPLPFFNTILSLDYSRPRLHTM